MKALIYKEFHTLLKPYLYLFMFAPILLLIPSYPYFVAFAFMIQAVFLYFNEARLSNDFVFTSILPVSKKRIVFSKHFSVYYLQVLNLIIAIPLAILSSFVVNTQGNLVGLDANMTLFGFILIDYAAFNLTVLPSVFKNRSKIGTAFVKGIIVIIPLHLFFEILTACVAPLSNALDGVLGETAIFRAAVLAGGIIVYVLSGFISYRLSCRVFEKVDI